MCEESHDNAELRDLLVENLSQSGTLAKIRAELRAHIFLALDDELGQDRNETEQPCNESDNIPILFLIYDFLSYHNFEYTLSVFEAETNYANNSPFKNRSDFLKKFSFESDDTPILLRVFQVFKNAMQENKCVQSLDSTYSSNKLYHKIVDQDDKAALEGNNDSNNSIIIYSNISEQELNKLPTTHDLHKYELKPEAPEEIISLTTDNDKLKSNEILDELNKSLNTSDFMTFKDEPQKRDTTYDTKQIPNIFEETIILRDVVGNIKNEEITSSSPLNVISNNSNLIKFNNLLSDISIVQKPEHASKSEVSYKNINIGSSDRIETSVNDNQISLEALYYKSDDIGTTLKKAESTEGPNTIHPKILENTHSFCNMSIKNICKQNVDDINSTSLPSFYVNVSNVDGFEIDLDSLDNYEEDILSLSSSNESKETLPKPDCVDRSMFTVLSEHKVLNAEEAAIGDGPVTINKCIKEIEESNIQNVSSGELN